jgi:hypothetical protein
MADVTDSSNIGMYQVKTKPDLFGYIWSIWIAPLLFGMPLCFRQATPKTTVLENDGLILNAPEIVCPYTLSEEMPMPVETESAPGKPSFYAWLSQDKEGESIRSDLAEDLCVCCRAFGFFEEELATLSDIRLVLESAEASAQAFVAMECAWRAYESEVLIPYASSFVYFLRQGDSGPIKIGVAVNPKKRKAQLQTSLVEPLHTLLILPGTRATEAHYHEKFADLRLRGEWFRPDPVLLDFIQQAIAEGRDVWS